MFCRYMCLKYLAFEIHNNFRIVNRDGDRKFNAAYPGEAVTKNSPILKDYKKAAAFGNVGGACAERFRHCPFSAADIISRVMEIIRTRPAIRSNE